MNVILKHVQDKGVDRMKKIDVAKKIINFYFFATSIFLCRLLNNKQIPNHLET